MKQIQDDKCIPQNSVIIHERDCGRWLLFAEPVAVYETNDLAAVMSTLQEIEERVGSEGLFAAGFVSYDASPAFNPNLSVNLGHGFPFLWFGLYNAPKVVSLCPNTKDLTADQAWEPDIDEGSYAEAISSVKEYITAGATYQVNYTFRLHQSLTRDPWHYFLQMIRSQGDTYGAYVKTSNWIVCSASPELFFQLNGRELFSKPMKGTAARGLQQKDDLAKADALRISEKDRAENVMIVDMVRNDFGRIAEPGSVEVPHLFEVEKYDTVWQLTSTVKCRTDASLCEIFGATFPPASITGAPKARTTEIIAELERSPRRLYTGTVGYIAPGRKAQFNVAIRTVLIERESRRAEYGVGGGVVWDSTNIGEWEECRNKSMVLTRRIPEFDLLETILWTPESGFFLLEYHLQRLADSADYFSRRIDIDAIRQQLEEAARQLPHSPHKMRLLIPEDGSTTVEAVVANVMQDIYALGVAKSPVNSANRFLYHKTTYRQVYQKFLADAADVNDVLLWNERNEITESCIANVVLEMDGRLITPPVECGLLPGIYRRWMLEKGQVVEAVVQLEKLKNCSRLFLINSVRGIWEPMLQISEK